MTFALPNLDVRKRGLPHEQPRTPEQIEANRRAWLDQHPALLAVLVVIVAFFAVAFAVAGAAGSISTITDSANRHGLTGWTAWTPWAGAEGVLVLMVVWRVFCGLRRRSSGALARLVSWGAAGGALLLNAAPSYEAGDWVGVGYHLAVPLATIVSVEVLERLVAAVVALILGTDQLAEADAAAVRTIRADRWVRRSHRWAALGWIGWVSFAPRAVARTHVERVIRTEPELLASATARIAQFAALDCGTAVRPAPAAPAEAPTEDDLDQKLGAAAPTVILERAHRPAADTLDHHAAEALALVSGAHAALTAAPAPAEEVFDQEADQGAPEEAPVFLAAVPTPQPRAEEVFDQEADQGAPDEQHGQEQHGSDRADQGGQSRQNGQGDQLDQGDAQSAPAEQEAAPTVAELRDRFVKYTAEGELDLALYLSGPGDRALGGTPPTRAEGAWSPVGPVAASAARMTRQVVTVSVGETSTDETGSAEEGDEEAEDPERAAAAEQQFTAIQAGTISQEAIDALTAGRDAANRERAQSALADRRELARNWWVDSRAGTAGPRVVWAVGHGTSEKRLRKALDEHPLASFTAADLGADQHTRAGVPAQAGRS